MTKRKPNQEKSAENSHSNPVDPVPEISRNPLLSGLLVAAAFAIIIGAAMYYGGADWSEGSAGMSANADNSAVEGSVEGAGQLMEQQAGTADGMENSATTE